MRQELVTSCLGSTTSTRGSLMATSLIQDMSKPYTFSHPDRAEGGRDLKQEATTIKTESRSVPDEHTEHTQEQKTHSGFCSPCTAGLR